MYQPITILLADSEEKDRALLSELCQRLGYFCHIACNGKEMIEAARSERPNLIITDAAMPDITGSAAAEWLKADPATAAIPIILVTELGWSGGWSNEVTAGPDYLLTRPYTQQQLLDTVQLFLG